MTYSWWEKLHMKVFGRWPDSVVQRRLQEDDLSGRGKVRGPEPEVAKQPLIPEGTYLVKIVEYARRQSEVSGRDIATLTCEIQDSEYKGVKIWKHLAFDTPKGDWVWRDAFQKISSDMVGEYRMLEVRQDALLGAGTFNRGRRFTHVPEHHYVIDMRLRFLSGPPVIGSSNPTVTRAMNEAVEAAEEVLRKHGCAITGRGYGSIYKGKASE